MDKCAIFRVFLRKILKEYKFSWIFKLCFLVLIPIALICTYLKISHQHQVHTGLEFDGVNKEGLYFPGGEDDKLFFYPDTQITTNIIEELRIPLDIIYQRVQGFNSLVDLDKAISENGNRNLYAIVFHQAEDSSLQYTIRNRNAANLATDKIRRNNYNELNNRHEDDYMDSGLLRLQIAINEIFLHHQNVSAFPVTFEHFPTGGEFAVTTNMDIVWFGSLLMVFCCLNVINTVLIPMVDEKESGVRSLLKIATRLFYYNEVARLLVNFCFFLIFITIIFGIVQTFGLWGQVSAIFPYLLTILFIFALISHTIALSLFFKRVEYCKIAGILFYTIPYLVLRVIGDDWFVKRLQYISPLNVFISGMEIVNDHVLTDRDINLNLLNEVPLESVGAVLKPHLFTIYGVLFINAIGYFIAYLLLKNIDSRDSLHRTVDKMIRRCCTSRVNNMEAGIAMAPPENAIVHVQQVVKQFHTCSTVKKAVNGVDMDVLKNEITVLLGHNGAGKTTLISMITGIIRPDAGKIWVNGLSDSRQYEQLIGYCPQKNVFVKQFNCYEHVTFFGRLRGIPAKLIQEEAEKVLNQVKLLPYASQYPCELSGGMKRRLCLAISIIGNTQVVILDEPTSGLDPKSRRDLWDILLRLKHERAILLTTHYMEEADILGDTIAIMEAGTIVCRDSPLELKMKYTSGYILKIVTDPNFNEDETTLLLNQEAPNNTIKSTIHPTRSFNIPYNLKPNYSTILRRLETNKKSLHINSVSITNPPLEEVFLRCSSMPDGDSGDEVDARSSYSVINAEGSGPVRKSNCDLFMRQLAGVFYKKMIHLRREWLYFLFLVCIPFACLYLSQFLIRLTISGVEQSRLKFSYENIEAGDSIIVAMKGVDYLEENRVRDIFKTLAPEVDFQFLHDTDLRSALNEKQREDVHFYNEKVLAAIEMNFQERNVNVFFSGNYLHGTPKSYNLVTNVLLALNARDPNHTPSVQTWTKPILRRTEDIGRKHVYIYENMMPMGLFLYILFFATDPFNDISTQFKSLFCLSAKVYWIVSLFFDLCIHAIVVTILTYVSYYASIVDLFDFETYAKLGTIYFVYAIPALSLLYILSKYVRTQENLYAIMFYMAVTGVVLSQLLSMSEEKVREYTVESQFLYILPDFGVRHAMSLAIYSYFKQGSDAAFDTTSYYVISILVGIIILLLLINVSEDMYIAERLKWSRCGTRNPKLMVQSPSNDFSDVVDSKVRMEKEQTQNLCRKSSDASNRLEYPVIVLNLKKVYDDKYAVKDLCFRVKKGECFGLLGTNGAGKTSTLEMMTLNRSLTDGAIMLNNIHCREEDQYRRAFGYCPQIDALNPSMTAFETIKYMALIKGVANVEAETNEWLKKCDLESYRNVPVGNYSGGTKRKLNTAIAMIGSPPVIFLDEPTTGIDPVSRRKIWLCIKELVQAGRTIILTSHSLDECEQLCNRIGIMYHGQLQCIGVTQELKNTLGDGYSLIIKLTESMGNDEIVQLKEKLKVAQFDVSGQPASGCGSKEQMRARLNELTEGVIVRLEECMVEMGMEWSTKDHHGSILKYRVDRKDIVWSEVFDTLMNLKERNSAVISDYSVNEVSLEDIFLQIGKQRDTTPE